MPSRRRATKGPAPKQGRGPVLRGVSRDQSQAASVELRKQSHREKNTQARTAIEQLCALAADPHTHLLADSIDRLTARPGRNGGRPRKHDTWMLVVFGGAISIFGSASATARNLAIPQLWSMVMDAAAPHLDPQRPLPVRGPSRDQWMYFTHRLDDKTKDAVEAFGELAVMRARQLGLADPGDAHFLRPPRSCTLGIDGKVFTSPLRTLATERVDPVTGEIRPIRHDSGRGQHREGGSSDAVWGTKFAQASLRASMLDLRVIVGVQHVPGGDGRGESGAFVELALDALTRLPGIRAIVADGALRGTAINHVQAITGIPVVSPPRRLAGKHGGIRYDGASYASQPLPPSKGQSRAFAKCSGHALIAAAGSIHERIVTADGTVHHKLVERGQVKRERRRDGTWAIRAQHKLRCSETDQTHTWWESLTALDTDGTFNRAEYLRVIPIGYTGYRPIYGRRADTESLHAQLEFSFHKQRLPAWGVHRQTLVVLLAAHTHNAWALEAWHREVARQHPPPDREAA